MEAILKFNLPEENHEFECAAHGSEAIGIIDDMNNIFRAHLKHRDPDEEYKTPTEAVEKLWEEFRELVDASNIPKE
jgi:hypothetical protein